MYFQWLGGFLISQIAAVPGHSAGYRAINLRHDTIGALTIHDPELWGGFDLRAGELAVFCLRRDDSRKAFGKLSQSFGVNDAW